MSPVPGRGYAVNAYPTTGGWENFLPVFSLLKSKKPTIAQLKDSSSVANKMRINKLLDYSKRWIPVLMWAVFIFYLSSIPNLSTGLGLWDIIIRKIAHILEYGILTFLLWCAVKNDKRPAYISLSWAAIFAIIYALTDEIHQGFVPTRHFSLYDVCIDSVGAILAAWIIRRRVV